MPSSLVLALTLALTGATARDPGAPAIGVSGARHLLDRAGLGGTPAEFARYSVLSREAAVSALVAAAPDASEPPPPEWTANTTPPARVRDLSPDERRQLQAARRAHGQELKSWWYDRLIRTERPLVERMTLFWHNHFTSSLRKVKDPLLMYRQNDLYRTHALGNFRSLLHAVAKDPAMLIYLDTVTNNRDKPNENFARELLELFTLGEGHYSERDIKEAARAFTGWKVDRRSGKFHRVAAQHDHGAKTFMKRTGTFEGEEILEIVLAQPRVAVHIVEKLWGEFIGGPPDPAEVQRLAGIFRESGYEIQPVVAAILDSEAFWSERNRGTLIKSPVELLVGVARALELPIRDGEGLVRAGRSLQQDLFDPPNVKGWPGGTTWISSTTLLVREQFLEQVGRGAATSRNGDTNMSMRGDDAADRVRSWFDRLGSDLTERVAAAQAHLCALPPIDEIKGSDTLAVIRQILTDPVYQLK